jgi:hypothetical protein
VLNHELVWTRWTYFTSYCFADNGESSPRGLHCRCSNDFDMRCGDHGCGGEDCVGQDKHWLCWAWQPTESTLFIKSMNLSLCSAICTTLAGSTVFTILLGSGFCIKKPYRRWYSLAFVEPLACVGLILSQQIIPLILGDLCKLIK